MLLWKQPLQILKSFSEKLLFCSDFPVGFFFRQILTFYLAICDGIFFIIRKLLLSWA